MYHNQKPNGASPPASTPSPAGSDPGGQASLGDCQQGDGKLLNPWASEDLCSRPTPSRGRCSVVGPLPPSVKVAKRHEWAIGPDRLALRRGHHRPHQPVESLVGRGTLPTGSSGAAELHHPRLVGSQLAWTRGPELGHSPAGDPGAPGAEGLCPAEAWLPAQPAGEARLEHRPPPAEPGRAGSTSYRAGTAQQPPGRGAEDWGDPAPSGEGPRREEGGTAEGPGH